MWQLAIRGDYKALVRKIDLLVRHEKRQRHLKKDDASGFFSLLIQEDTKGLKEFIEKSAFQRSSNPLWEDFFCYPGTQQLKLCWVKGMEIHVESPLIPMSLMPVRPLDNYSYPYDNTKRPRSVGEFFSTIFQKRDE
jgi:hypothetical protein